MVQKQGSGVLADLSQQAIDDSIRWFPGSLELGLPFTTLALAGEVGELANLVKKIQRGSIEFTPKVKYEVSMEVTDVFIYLLIAAGLLRIDLEESYYVKRQFNESRFGNKGESNGTVGPVRLIVPGETREGS